MLPKMLLCQITIKTISFSNMLLLSDAGLKFFRYFVSSNFNYGNIIT